MTILKKKAKKSRRGGLRKKDKLLIQADIPELNHLPKKQLLLLYRAICKKDYKAVLHLCRASNDPLLNQIKVVSLIKSEQYEQALHLIKLELKRVECTSTYLYQKAYCEYRLSQYAKALATLRKLKQQFQITNEEKRGILCLKAQIFLRLNKFDKSLKAIQKLTPGGNISKAEINTNSIAIRASKGLFSLIPPTKVDPMKMYQATTMEEKFNLGSLCISQGQIETGILLLQEAEQLALEDRSKSALNSIRLQLGYAHQICGNVTKAKQCYQSLKKKGKGPEIILSQNNLEGLAPISKRELKQNSFIKRNKVLRQNLLGLCKDTTLPLWQRMFIYISLILRLSGRKTTRLQLTSLLSKPPFNGLDSHFRHVLQRIIDQPNLPKFKRTSKSSWSFLNYVMYLHSLFIRRKHSELRKRILRPPSFLATLPGFISTRAHFLKSTPRSKPSLTLAIRSLLRTKNVDAIVQACTWLACSDVKSALTHLSSLHLPKARAQYLSLLALVDPTQAKKECFLSLASSSSKSDSKKENPTQPKMAVLPIKKKCKRKKRLPKPLPAGQLPPFDPHRWLSKHAKINLGLVQRKPAASSKKYGSGVKKRGGGTHARRGRGKRR